MKRVIPSPSLFGEYIRLKINDYNSLTSVTDNFTGDGSTTSFTLSTYPLSMIKTVTVDGVSKEWLTDWYIDWSDVTAPKIVFEEAPPDQAAISVTYDSGTSWVRWSDVTITADELPMITLDVIYSRADRPPGLSFKGRSLDDTLLHSLLIDVSVWVEENKSYIYEGETYWGTDLGFHMQDKITSLLYNRTNYDYLLNRGIRFEGSFGLMRLAASPEAEQPPYISRVAKTYAFILELTI